MLPTIEGRPFVRFHDVADRGGHISRAAFVAVQENSDRERTMREVILNDPPIPRDRKPPDVDG